jgi:hypothetical protein
LTFLAYVEQLCNNLVGGYEHLRRVPVVAANPDNVQNERRLENVGQHGVERALHATRNNACVVCLEKYRRASIMNPNAAYKDLPSKKKTVYWCPYCEKFLCVGLPDQNCWKDWHSKVQYWR